MWPVWNPCLELQLLLLTSTHYNVQHRCLHSEQTQRFNAADDGVRHDVLPQKCDQIAGKGANDGLIQVIFNRSFSSNTHACVDMLSKTSSDCFTVGTNLYFHNGFHAHTHEGRGRVPLPPRDWEEGWS